MRKAYIYPNTEYINKVPNPYLENLITSLKDYYVFVNIEKPSKTGFLDILKYIRSLEYLFLNWIEDLPDKKGGWIQSIIFILIIYVLKTRNIKIIWTMHNRLSHYSSNQSLKKFLFRFLLLKSDLVITHSREGIHYAKQFKIKNYAKIKYFPHPLEKKFVNFKNNPAYDILIWGSIIPYKGIDKFLQYLFVHNFQNKYKIQIIGRVKPDSYFELINQYCNENIRIENRYFPEKELKNRIADSKIVVFTYIGNSVLSSGVLMDNLSYGAFVLAPCVGAFKDAEEDELIKTYTTYDDLIPLIDNYLNCPLNKSNTVLNKFIEKSDWHQFSVKIHNWLS